MATIVGKNTLGRDAGIYKIRCIVGGAGWGGGGRELIVQTWILFVKGNTTLLQSNIALYPNLVPEPSTTEILHDQA